MQYSQDESNNGKNTICQFYLSVLRCYLSVLRCYSFILHELSMHPSHLMRPNLVSPYAELVCALEAVAPIMAQNKLTVFQNQLWSCMRKYTSPNLMPLVIKHLIGALKSENQKFYSALKTNCILHTKDHFSQVHPS